VFSEVIIYFFSWLDSPSNPRPPLCGSLTTLRHTTLDRTRLDSSMEFWAVIILVEPTMTAYAPRATGEKYVEIWSRLHILQNRFLLCYMPHSPSYVFVSSTNVLYRSYYGTSRTGDVEKETCFYISFTLHNIE
jgi:hypothetical protein